MIIFLSIIGTYFFTMCVIRTLLARFYDRIKHGDQEHQAWLKKEFESYWGIKIK